MKHAFPLLILLATFAPPQDQRPTVRSGTAGVLIDVTVVDKDGRPVMDLTASDFAINEDGKPQQIVSATLMRGGVPVPLVGTTSAPAPPETAVSTVRVDSTGARVQSPTAPTPTVTAILFQSLSVDSRAYAARAAVQLISTLQPPHQYAGVFLGGLGFTTLQRFTNNRADIRRAIDRIASTAPNEMSVDREQARTSSRIAGLDPSTPVTANPEYGRGYTTIHEREALLHGSDPESMLRLMEYTMEQGYAQILAELEGEAALASLRTAVRGLAALPGRKSILYFTEALPITSRLKSHLDALIGEANRANVTIYPVDAVGLRTQSKEAGVGRGVNLAGAQGIGDASRERGAWTKDLEKQEDAVSSRPASVLGRLANETAGFLIDNTNDLGKGVARMQVERTTYYLLGYQPTNAALDGKFRKVTVKVRRGKYTIRARPGYLAPH